MKKVCSAQKQYCAEHADSMESGNVEERNRHYRSLKMQAAGAWLFAVPLLLLSIFRDHVTYGNEIQMLLAIPVLLFLGVSLYTDAWKQFRMGRITMDMLIAFSMFVAFLFSLFNTFFPDYWYEVGLQPHVYYEVAVLTAAVGLTGKVFRFLPDELHDGDRMAGIIFPVLTGIAILVFVIWILFGGMEAVPHALYSVISIFIVACPCALGLVTPVALMRGIGKAARMHILIKDSLALERLSKADIVVFDKTGTLTYATPKVAQVIPFGGHREADMLRLAACLEEHYPHSMANAVVEEAKRRGLTHEEYHSQVQYVVAHGISSMVEGKKVIIGSAHFVFEDEGCCIPAGERPKFDALPAAYSHLYLCIDGELAAVICIHDPLRREAREAVRALHESGFANVVMMTGDNRRTAEAVAAEVGVNAVYAEVLPEDKAAFIRQEKEKGHTVIMVGDGVNDSPALSEADAGIAISTGAAIAREIADITVASEDLFALVTLRRLSQALMQRIHGSYRFIVGFNLTLIVLGVAGVLPPTASALLHNGSTLGISLRNMTDLLDENKS